jgi:hypothetical protein
MSYIYTCMKENVRNGSQFVPSKALQFTYQRAYCIVMHTHIPYMRQRYREMNIAVNSHYEGFA